MFSQPEVIAAIVLGTCTIFATLIAAFAAAKVGKRFQNQKKIKADLREAISDLEFLLAVEKEHCELHRMNTGQSQMRTI